MLFDRFVESKTRYDPLAAGEADASFEESRHGQQHSPSSSQHQRSRGLRNVLAVLSYLLVAAVSFGGGILYQNSSLSSSRGRAGLDGVAPRIPLPLIKSEFMDKTPFLEEPPRGEGSGNISEPIWDELVPNGLGYFKDGRLAPKASIPTVFHQLHCLYLIRRAYYQGSNELQEFDFGKDRDAHVAHCLDYLRQGLTCTIDTTVEPAVENEGDFLGFGFQRQCHDFQALKDFVEEHRVFNASGFLAAGLDHGHAHLGSHSKAPSS